MRQRLAIWLGLLVVATVGAFVLRGYLEQAGEPTDPPVTGRKPQSLYESPPDGAVHVLFVGNSFTFLHDVPAMVQRLAAASPTVHAFWIDGVVTGGRTLEGHWKKGIVQRHLETGNWDVLVLQGQSYEPVAAPDSFLRHTKLFAALAKRSGARVVLYETWVDAPHPLASRENLRVGLSLQEFQELQRTISVGYETAAGETGAAVATVGQAWARFIATNAEIKLHARDRHHASLRGAYLAACVLFEAISGESAQGNTYAPPGIALALVQKLQAAASSRAPEQSEQPDALVP